MRRLFTPFLFIALLAVGYFAHASSFTKGRAVAPFTSALRPGDYIWHPEISPAGPVIVLVSLPDQVLYVYRNGVRIGRSTVSTGTKGHRTPSPARHQSGPAATATTRKGAAHSLP